MLLFAGCAARQASPPAPITTLAVEGPDVDAEQDRQRLLRRTELYAGGLSADPAIASEQAAKLAETKWLLGQAERSTHAGLRRARVEAAAAVGRFELDLQRASPRLRAEFDRWHQKADRLLGSPEAGAELEQALHLARVYLALLEAARDELAPSARERLEHTERRVSSPTAPASPLLPTGAPPAPVL